ncbi:hypothetical protein LDENG_00182090 [Lucifuga dentata]|nr:hypothetical protein LDENG_00182090 [Lucifuga dentata]
MDQQIEIVESYKYLGVHLDNKLNWKKNTNVLLKKASLRLFFLRKLRSFNVCNKLLHVFFIFFYHGILASVLVAYAVPCWCTITLEDRNRINKLIKKAGSILIHWK